MSKVIGIASILAGGIAASLASADTLRSPDMTSAKSFVERIYVHYRYPGGDHWSEGARAWSPFDKATARMLFDPATLRLMADNDRLAKAAGYEGALDSDPFCDCQDHFAVRWVVTAQMANSTAARAIVRGGSSPILIDLRSDGARWRVFDVWDQGESMRANLINDSRQDAAQLGVSYKP